MDKKVPSLMVIIHEILGNIAADDEWKALHRKMAGEGRVYTVSFSRLESERSRLLKKLPELNEEIGINLKRGAELHNGDVLYCRANEIMLLARIEPEEVMVLTFAGQGHEDALFEAGVRLGHALGNQHWHMKVAGKKVFVPVTLDRKVMESVMKTHNIPGVEYSFTTDDASQVSQEKPGCFSHPGHSHHPGA